MPNRRVTISPLELSTVICCFQQGSMQIPLYSRDAESLAFTGKHANQLAGATWRDLRGSGTSPAFLPWTHLAKVVDEDHKQAYPGYIYRKRNRRKGRPEPPLAGTSTSNSTVEAGVASQSRAQVCHDCACSLRLPRLTT